MPMPLSQWLLLAVLAVMWGAAYPLVSVALQELPPLTVVLGRLGIAALVLAAVARWMGLAWPRGLAGWMPFAVMGLLNNVIPFAAIAYGQLGIPSGLASVIVATTPLWTVLMSRLLLPGERIDGLQLAGILLGVAGVGVLFGPELTAGRASTIWGMAMVLLAAISYGLSGVWGARLRGAPPITSSCCQLISSSAIMAVLVAFVDQPWRLGVPGVQTIFSVLFLAVIATALAYIVFYRILTVSGGTNVMLVTLMMPPIAIGLGIVLLGEELSARHVAGALVIGCALVTIDGRLPRALRRLAG